MVFAERLRLVVGRGGVDPDVSARAADPVVLVAGVRRGASGRVTVASGRCLRPPWDY